MWKLQRKRKQTTYKGNQAELTKPTFLCTGLQYYKSCVADIFGYWKYIIKYWYTIYSLQLRARLLWVWLPRQPRQLRSDQPVWRLRLKRSEDWMKHDNGLWTGNYVVEVSMVCLIVFEALGITRVWANYHELHELTWGLVLVWGWNSQLPTSVLPAQRNYAKHLKYLPSVHIPLGQSQTDQLYLQIHKWDAMLNGAL